MEFLAETVKDMYVCNVCNHNFHWSCLLRLGCYKDEGREFLKRMKPGAALLVLATLIQRKSPGITSLQMRN